MRLEAIKVLNRVLRAGKQETPFPLTDLTRMLLFEDEEDAEEFALHCGLEVSCNLISLSSMVGDSWRK